MLFILNGNSEIIARQGSNLGFAICFRHLFKSRAATKIFCPENTFFFFHACATCPELPSNISAMVLTLYMLIQNKKY